MTTDDKSKYPHPPLRKLRIFSFDPAADISLETAGINRCTLQIPWESVRPGPIGEYLEVVDLDPSSGCAYEPVDLMDPHLLASHGLPPSTGNPQFHQQMVYAVAMKTIANFERVLGRHVQWSERIIDDNNRYIREPERRYVDRLRIYPHALREQNAYFSPSKKALLFGYFNATTSDPRDELPGGVVFTCLSHDIIAHETTHAIIDGLHRRLLDDTNADMLAFHEAFADIVAIFQHFTLPGVLLDQIQCTRGDLRVDNLLAKLASQFARATGRGGVLRDALGERGPDGRQLMPDPKKLAHTNRPHERGAILVAAVFDAFLRIYENRVCDLRRIATGGTGVLPQGDIHPDLAGRFAEEASKTSQHVLSICIRALDYLPPVDVTFGDFLRSLITADAEFYANDERHYRLAFIKSFSERGIYPSDVRTLSEDSLRWTPMDDTVWEQLGNTLPPPTVLRTMAYTYGCESKQLIKRLRILNDRFMDLSKSIPLGQEEMAREFLEQVWLGIEDCETVVNEPTMNELERLKDSKIQTLAGTRFNRYQLERQFARFLHRWILEHAASINDQEPDDAQKQKLDAIGFNFGLDFTRALRHKDDPYQLRLEVHAVRPTIRLRPDGKSKVELLVQLTQSNRKDLPESPKKIKSDKKDATPVLNEDGEALQYKFRGGCTLLIDPEEGRVRHSIGKSLLSERRRSAHEAFLLERLAMLGVDAIERYSLRPAQENEVIDGKVRPRPRPEPFAITHRHEDAGDEGYG